MAARAKYSATTRQILVSVHPTYLDDQSAPEQSHFVWAYHIVIENRGDETVQLRSRHCASPMRVENSTRYAVRVWSASSRALSPAMRLNISATCR